MTNCGARSESCCASLDVSGGTYYRTYVSDTDGGPTGEGDPATVSGFRLDKYLVTVGRFRRFVNVWNDGAGYLPPAASGKHTHLNGGQGLVNAGDDAGVEYEPGWSASDDGNIAPTSANLACDPTLATWTALAGTNENLPINCVDWYEAYAFCTWDGGFLPSEAEWEYAAAGGSQQREYPWGSTDPGAGSQYAIYGCHYPSGSGPPCAGLTSIAPVGTALLGAGLWGQLDLTDDMWEWILDWGGRYVNPCMDCAYLTATSGRLFRGGTFNGDTQYLNPFTGYFPYTPVGRDQYIGFRCARAP
jgi:formylglycine-generating enzyme